MTNEQLQIILKLIDELKIKIVNFEAGEITNMPELEDDDSLADFNGDQKDTNNSDWEESNKTF